MSVCKQLKEVTKKAGTNLNNITDPTALSALVAMRRNSWLKRNCSGRARGRGVEKGDFLQR